MMAGGNIYGRAGGIIYSSTADKVFNCMNALGSIGEPGRTEFPVKGWRGGGVRLWAASARARRMRTAHAPPLPLPTRPPLGCAGFAWGFCYVQLEVHDTVK